MNLLIKRQFEQNEIFAFKRAFHRETPGGVFNFNKKTFSEFFKENFEVDIYDKKYLLFGAYKSDRLITFLMMVEANLASRVLKLLWEYQSQFISFNNYLHQYSGQEKREKEIQQDYFNIIQKLELEAEKTKTDGIEVFDNNKDLEKIVSSIQHYLDIDQPEVALDRLHTYCKKRFNNLLNHHQLNNFNNSSALDPLHNLAGAYMSYIISKRNSENISIFPKLIKKISNHIFEGLNDLRNDNSFAHNKPLINKYEAQLIFDLITSILRFVKRIEADKI